MHFSKVRLRTGERGTAGALSAFLARNAAAVGRSHHLVWSLFGDTGSKRPFVYHMTGASPSDPILIYSEEPVSDAHGLWEVETRPFSLPDGLAAGDRVAWQIRVNATVKSPDGRKRHDIVTAAKHAGADGGWTEVARKVVPAWLAPKLAAGGLECPADAMAVSHYDKLRFSHDARRGAPPVTIAVADVQGIATVTDPALLRDALAKGIGAGRAYGCGMLLVRRAA